VAVLERSDKVGGTTAVSGGGIWIPMNHHMREAGIQDSREEALTYCKRLTAGRAPDELVETFVDTAHRMVRYLEEHTPIKFSVWSAPDYHSEEPGAKLRGRSIEPQIFDTNQLGEWRGRLRPAPIYFLPLPLEELIRSRVEELPFDVIGERMEKGIVAMGNALVGALLKGCLDRGIAFLLEIRGRELIREGDRVIGLRAERDGKPFLVKARRGIVLACGGFEWSEELRARFLPGPVTHPQSPPYNEGDGLLMAMEVGADLGNMTEVWGSPSSVIPGEQYEGKPFNRISTERARPHAILVNRHGQRFVNEAVTYNDLNKVFYEFDPTTYEYRNLPCWLICDGQYREKYAILTVTPADSDPDWVVRDETLEGLAQKTSIHAQGLYATIARFNNFVREGRDQDFRRGESAVEREMGDRHAPHPTLGTIEKPPFYALPVYSGTLGTKGGPRTNTKGQVLNVRGQVIPSLYAAGNVMASPAGAGYYGAGGTMGPGMTWGYICGINAGKARE
jgi:succinate dehydrogenase/fumarate reductase flavoprotein subunit